MGIHSGAGRAGHPSPGVWLSGVRVSQTLPPAIEPQQVSRALALVPPLVPHAWEPSGRAPCTLGLPPACPAAGGPCTTRRCAPPGPPKAGAHGASPGRGQRARVSTPAGCACPPPPRVWGLPRKCNNIYDQREMRKCSPSTQSTALPLAASHLSSPSSARPHTCVWPLQNGQRSQVPQDFPSPLPTPASPAQASWENSRLWDFLEKGRSHTSSQRGAGLGGRRGGLTGHTQFPAYPAAGFTKYPLYIAKWFTPYNGFVFRLSIICLENLVLSVSSVFPICELDRILFRS